VYSAATHTEEAFDQIGVSLDVRERLRRMLTQP
jgi:hypothetical protein